MLLFQQQPNQLINTGQMGSMEDDMMGTSNQYSRMMGMQSQGHSGHQTHTQH